MPVSTAGESALARAMVLAATLFTLVLCFVHTNLFPVSNSLTAACELAILGVVALLVAQKSADAILLLTVIAAYVLLLAVLRYSLDLKTIRDLAIPVLFFALGKQYGSLQSADRLVSVLLYLVAFFAAVEWLFLPAYVKIFDIQSFYISRGAIDAATQGNDGGLFTSGLRFEGRTLFPIIGEHRVSSVFLEPISLGNFAAIVLMWALYRMQQNYAVFLFRAFIVLCLLILGDARFGIYLSALLLIVFFLGSLIRPAMIFAAPFLVMLALAFWSFGNPNVAWDNTSVGRMLLGGQLLTSLDLSQVFGIGESGAGIVDSGYAYLLAQFGILGFTCVWALFVFRGSNAGDGWSLKLAAAVYLVCLLAISASPMTIKTAALLWFLVGAAERRSGNHRSPVSENQFRTSSFAIR